MIQTKRAGLLLAASGLLACNPATMVKAEQTLPMVVVEDEAGASDSASAYSRFALPPSVEATETLTRKEIEAIRPRDVYDLIEGSLGMTISRGVIVAQDALRDSKSPQRPRDETTF